VRHFGSNANKWAVSSFVCKWPGQLNRATNVGNYKPPASVAHLQEEATLYYRAQVFSFKHSPSPCQM
jgi:hypothetical protein